MTIQLRIHTHASWQALQLRVAWNDSAFKASVSLPLLRIALRVESDDRFAEGTLA